MDPNPLIVDYYTPIDQVSKLTMTRPQNKIYDEVIVNKDGYYYNTMSIKDLLLKISKRRILEARNANPLSGLPGNLSINREINNRIQANKIFSVLYIDLDNFKAFNDTYGYQKGDQLINYTAKLLKRCAASLDKNSFVGHIGGDDFIIIVNSAIDTKLAENIIEVFNKNLKQFFNPIDWNRGFVLYNNRQGETCQLPLTSLSIAIVSTEALTLQNHLEISDRAAEIKRIVKKRPGSNYLKDRR
jgi:diguanylate cyclase (GGDEF)-like protein